MAFPSILRRKIANLSNFDERLKRIQEALGRIESRQCEALGHEEIIRNEFRVFSQWGEDGIVQHLLRSAKIDQKVFVEFGVEKYAESNTRFLLTNDNWSGVVLDGSKENIDAIRNDPIYWQYNLKAECAFITRENINELLVRQAIRGEIGLLSIDIDGNDYWVWEAVEIVHPAIVIVEYNARFGRDRAVVVPYDPGFLRSKAHPSMIYFGASLKALCSLGRKKGYAFVGCNSAGNDAFFVRRDLISERLPEIDIAKGFVPNQFREARNPRGEMAYLTYQEEQQILAALPVISLEPLDREGSLG